MMKFKLDENFEKNIQEIFLKAGYDVHTVYDEGLQGTDDNKIYNICYKEQRCLVTLDLIITGYNRTEGLYIFKIYTNNGVGNFDYDISPGVGESSIALGDTDSDGD